MFVSLLIDRFKLQSHWESRETQAYSLSAGNDGPKIKLHPPPPGGAAPGRALVTNGYLPNGQMRFVFTSAPISKLADLVAIWLAHPVLDDTGLLERYDFSVDYTPPGAERSPGDSDGGPSISPQCNSSGSNSIRSVLS
jgi:uncharacterized protein (TIGR03435 family)